MSSANSGQMEGYISDHGLGQPSVVFPLLGEQWGGPGVGLEAVPDAFLMFSEGGSVAGVRAEPQRREPVMSV